MGANIEELADMLCGLSREEKRELDRLVYLRWVESENQVWESYKRSGIVDKEGKIVDGKRWQEEESKRMLYY